MSCTVFFRKSLLLFLALTVLPACSTEQRVAHRLEKLNTYPEKKVRAWPYNYTYNQYAEMFDEARVLRTFYRKRKGQYRSYGAEKTAKTMDDNIKKYKKKIKRLKKDRPYYRIYRLQQRIVKEELKKQKRLEKKKAKSLPNGGGSGDLGKSKREIKKQRKAHIKERENRLDERRVQIEEQRKELVRKLKDKNKALKQKEQERAALINAIEHSRMPDNDLEAKEEKLTRDIERLEKERQNLEIKIDETTEALEDFIRENYGSDADENPSQMRLSTDPVL